MPGALSRHEGRRYADIQRDLPQIPPVTLTRLLRELEEQDVVVRVHVAGSPSRVEFIVSGPGRSAPG
ncbi:winged helix-turn-helix transcriptional regulator [Paractinoplanes hotanensis]|uniref:Winged helix-turn-helix transcriptional regulator n=1 Tax=Paractinoplanes hotanensis TaxID=2906497 RepID=A0ABT0YDY1_9ACTN|nr:winged helix-turn-helix transcriptional regulator [Actinoplanes hotanensis]MCM4084266.1 winged helix-turn-helix transcriptional regulator [Actinoplanes hotanensis]